jgi:hypothetical protein
MNLFKKNLNSYLFWFITIAAPLVITLQNIFVVPDNTETFFHTHYNNFIIFKQSFFHLIQHKNLYLGYASEHEDLYKYSPTFALFMGVFGVFPNWLGLFIWNLLGAFILMYAITKVVVEKNKRLLLFLFMLPEFVLTIQNSQSNAIITGFVLLAFYVLNKGENGLAALLIIATVFIKLFTLVALIMFLFYPNKIKSAIYVFIWGIIFLCLPLIAVGGNDLYQQYLNWVVMLKNDHSISYGLSFISFLHGIHLFTVNKLAVLIFGIIVLLLPLFRYNYWNNDQYKRNYLFFILIWMVVFNHKAESPSYIIAITACGLWAYFNDNAKYRFVLIVLCFIFSSLVCTDIFPASFRNGFIQTYSIKAIMPSVFLFVIAAGLLFKKEPKQNNFNFEAAL